MVGARLATEALLQQPGVLQVSNRQGVHGGGGGGLQEDEAGAGRPTDATGPLVEAMGQLELGSATLQAMTPARPPLLLRKLHDSLASSVAESAREAELMEAAYVAECAKYEEETCSLEAEISDLLQREEATRAAVLSAAMEKLQAAVDGLRESGAKEDSGDDGGSSGRALR